MEVSGGISLDEDIADERACGVVIFELAEMRFPGGIGGGKRVRGGARGEQGEERKKEKGGGEIH